jgi:hypothetical protein
MSDAWKRGEVCDFVEEGGDNKMEDMKVDRVMGGLWKEEKINMA